MWALLSTAVANAARLKGERKLSQCVGAISVEFICCLGIFELSVSHEWFREVVSIIIFGEYQQYDITADVVDYRELFVKVYN